MKKKLTIIIAALLVAAMAIPASAAELTLDGAYKASWKYDTGVWSPTNLQEASTLVLNLEFNEGESIVAYLPLTIKPFVGTPAVSVGNWYFSYETDPVQFWVSNNNSENPKKFVALGDPLGIGAKLGEGIVLNAKGDILGADVNIYAAGLADKNEAYLGRVTYDLPAEFTLGVVGAYTEVDEKDNDLTLGADVVGKIPGVDAKLTLAGAGYLVEDPEGGFQEAIDNYAYLIKLSDIAIGPVEDAWASYTGVGENFLSRYATLKDGTILKDYDGHGALEVGATVGIPVGVPVDVTLGNGLWMTFGGELEYNETTAEIVAEPLEDLELTLSGAYKADLNDDDDEDFTGYKVHGDAAYDAFGLTFKPYADYKVDSYAEVTLHGEEQLRKDTIVGLEISGNPIIDELEVGLDSSYTFEEPKTWVRGWGIYTTDLNPGFVQSANSQVAAVASYNAEPDTNDATNTVATTDVYGYAGTDLVITDAFGAKLGVLSKDSLGGVVASANLTYKVSESIETGLTYTFRQEGVEGWEHYKDGGKNYVKASATGTVGDSTITIAYGVDGLKEADTTGFHKDKPWKYLRNHPEVGMNWQLLTLSVNVPF